jgi:DNA repair exonuclease SbcCD ATPase subunit
VDEDICDRLNKQDEVAEHAGNIAYGLQQVQDALAALRAAVEAWQRPGRLAEEEAVPRHGCIVPQEAAGPEQQQKQQQQQHAEGEQLNRYQQAQQEVQQDQQQLQQRQHQEQQQLEGVRLRTKQQQEQKKQSRQRQEDQQQIRDQEQKRHTHLLPQLLDMEQQLVGLEKAQLQQLQSHLEQELEQLQRAFRAYAFAVEDLAGDVSVASNTSLRLAGCSWVGCTQQHKGTYSAEAAVAGLRGVRCGGCGLVRYCCPQHQQADWPHHRRVCRRLAQTRAAAAGCAGGGGGSAGTS